MFAHILNREIREFDFLSGRVFHTRSIRSLLPGRGVSVGNWAGDRQQTAEQKDESRIIFHSLKVRHGIFVLKVRSTSQVYCENVSWERFHVSLILLKCTVSLANIYANRSLTSQLANSYFSFELSEVGQ